MARVKNSADVGFHTATMLAPMVLLLGAAALICSCARPLLVERPSAQQGAIYGKVYVASTAGVSGTVTVTIEDTNRNTVVDSSGVFYLDDLRPGVYTLIAQREGFMDGVLQNVEVSADSITFATNLSLRRKAPRNPPKTWSGSKIRLVDLRRRGCVVGRVSYGRKPVPGASATLSGTIWSTLTDSLGQFVLRDVLVGRYDLSTLARGFHRDFVKDVVVIDGETSLAEVRLSSGMIPERPFPVAWRPRYSSGCE